MELRNTTHNALNMRGFVSGQTPWYKVDRLQENFDKISQECDALKQAILRQVFE